MDSIWEEPKRAVSGIWVQVRTRLVAAIALVALISGFLTLAIVDTVLARLHVLSDTAVHIVAIFGVIVCVFVFFAVVYRTVPQERPRWRQAILASLVTTALVVLGQIAFAIYLHYVNFGSAYGDAGSVVILLVWLYYSCAAALAGAELARAVEGV